jgi:histidine triad (HIT) family protein
MSRTVAALVLLILALAAPANAIVAPGTTPGSSTGLYGAYDDGNAFARILAGTLPATKVYEDEQVLAFMNIHPVSVGDLLVIPKGNYRNLMDIPPLVLAHLMRVAQLLAKAQARALLPDGIFLRENNGEEAGQTVFHFHIHVTPQYRGVALAQTSYAQPPAEPRTLEIAAGRIQAAMTQIVSADPMAAADACGMDATGATGRNEHEQASLGCAGARRLRSHHRRAGPRRR